ncbi:MAG TPA: YbdK family carboxylate-amine ligase [Actinophytocola sp.]|jgi:carboxylate-amine ligase|uniref:carboxylate-amine ligase n=1 Tax=Actinophytocola sp. TaxID=1872138 RepID=UPI002F94DCAB
MGRVGAGAAACDGVGWSLGVEEEFLLVDRGSGGTVADAERVLRDAGRAPGIAVDATVQPELLATQVEAATGRCSTLAGLAHQLRHNRRRLAAAAGELLLVPSGVPVIAGQRRFTVGERFERIAGRYAGLVREYQACGCHVHVGVPDPEAAVAVVNHVRPWLPTLLALSVNSPVLHGADTGYASWRMVEQSRFPGSGVPPRFSSARDYAARVGRLVAAGALIDPAQSFWLVRPSPRLPTVEFRVADVSIDVDGALLQAALSRALVRTALADAAAGRPVPELDEQVAAAAVWSAARYGLDGPAVHPLLARRVPAVALVGDLVETVRPALIETGDLTTVERLLKTLVTGAERQRAAGAPTEIVKMLAEAALQDGDAG